MLATRLSKQRFESEKAASIEWCEANGSRLPALGQTALAELRSFDLGADSCAVILYSSYADIPAGRVYDTAFKLSDPAVADRTEAKLRLAILNRRLPLLSLEHGHHHLAVFDFVGGVPEIVTSLPIDHFDGGIGGPLAGLCDAPTWKSILERGRDD
jgi:hypothetical protein